jgi:hypothetical protein
MRRNTKPLIDYIPKKCRPYVKDCYRSEQCYGWLYSAVLEWPDGFCRLVDEESIADFVWKVRALVEDREAQY